jgi:hypothetical protein
LPRWWPEANGPASRQTGVPPPAHLVESPLIEVAHDDDEPILLEDNPADTTVLAKGQGDALLDMANDADDDHMASPNDLSILVPAPCRTMELSKKFPFTLFFIRTYSETVKDGLVQAIAKAAFIVEMFLLRWYYDLSGGGQVTPHGCGHLPVPQSTVQELHD